MPRLDWPVSFVGFSYFIALLAAWGPRAFPNMWRDALLCAVAMSTWPQLQFVRPQLFSLVLFACGAAFGLSHHFFQVGPFRPANQDPTVRNVFFVGASTQPGTGLPMVMLSAKLVTERLLHWAAAREEVASGVTEAVA